MDSCVIQDLKHLLKLFLVMSGDGTASAGDSWKRDPLFWVYSVLLFVPVVMVFVFYNYYMFAMFVYLGWLLLVLGFVIVFLAGGEFRRRGGVPEGESVVHTTVLVDSGVYSVVRHPQYLGFMLIVFALVLMSQHWLTVFSGVTGSILFYRDILKEEESNIEKFGADYKAYMERVPRMNILVGVLRLLRRRRK